MKKIWVVFLLVFVVVGCDNNRKILLEREVKIERLEFGINPWIEIVCKEATLNYEKRELTVRGLTAIRGGGAGDSGWITSQMSIIDNDLFILFPSDTNFYLYVGKQYHFLPEIK